MDMEIAPLFKNVVYNNDVELAVSQMKEVILKEMAKNNGNWCQIYANN